MKEKTLIAFIFITVFAPNHFCQNDTSKINSSKILLNPSFAGVQLEAISSLVSSELGLIIDFDIYSSTNKKYNFGLRISSEYYDFTSLDVGGKRAPGPFMDYNIYGRHTIRGEHLSFSPILGLSLHKSLGDRSADLELVMKWGIELKYNFFNNRMGMLLKFAASSFEDVGYAGVGLAICLFNK